MVRRSGAITGLGNPAPDLMDGQSTGSKQRDKLINRCAKECYMLFFAGTQMDYKGIDAQARGDEIRLGIEPAYFGDNLKMLVLAENKDLSYIITGHAFGYYGSGIRSTCRQYKDYKRSAKFTRFVDKWHSLLFTA